MTGIAAWRAALGEGADASVRIGALCEHLAGDEPIGAFAEVHTADALHAADRSAPGDGPLAGVPVAVKDTVGVAGHVNRGGTAVLERRADEDSTMVARLRAAGAVVLGTTHMTELGLSAIGVNPVTGSPANPHDLTRTPGGSSSGSAAAVAAGHVAAAVGSDGGGSIRIPAALCGLVGLKPTPGAVPVDGTLTTGWWSLSAYGPLAIDVAEAALVHQVLADLPLRAPEPSAELIVGVCDTWWGDPDDAIDLACRVALNRQGWVTRPVDVASVGLARALLYATAGSEVGAAVAEVLGGDPNAFSPATTATLLMAREVTGIDYVRAQRLRSVLADELTACLGAVDVLAVPSTHCTAPERDPAWDKGVVDEVLLRRLTATTFPANLCGLPAISVPIGADEGLPIGLTLVAAPGRESLLCDAAARIEADLGPAAPAPHRHDPLR